MKRRLSSTALTISFSTDRLIPPRPNDRNMPTQHIATLLGAACLSAFGNHVEMRWVLLA